MPGADTGVVLFTPEGHEDRVGTFHSISFWTSNVQKTYDELVVARRRVSSDRRRRPTGAARRSSRIRTGISSCWAPSSSSTTFVFVRNVGPGAGVQVVCPASVEVVTISPRTPEAHERFALRPSRRRARRAVPGRKRNRPRRHVRRLPCSRHTPQPSASRSRCCRPSSRTTPRFDCASRARRRRRRSCRIRTSCRSTTWASGRASRTSSWRM